MHSIIRSCLRKYIDASIHLPCLECVLSCSKQHKWADWQSTWDVYEVILRSVSIASCFLPRTKCACIFRIDKSKKKNTHFKSSNTTVTRIMKNSLNSDVSL